MNTAPALERISAALARHELRIFDRIFPAGNQLTAKMRNRAFC
jgi:hypothetical protein